MNSEPNYKVLSTVTINGNKVELRQYKDYWGVAKIDEHGNTEETIRNDYKKAKWTYLIQTYSHLSK